MELLKLSFSGIVSSTQTVKNHSTKQSQFEFKIDIDFMLG